MKKIKNDVQTERITSQKQVVLDYLKSIKAHPTAEDVFLEARKKLPRISQTTVYRILNNFSRKNQAQMISVKGVAHFDGDVSPHAHFICRNCDNIFDIFDVCSKCEILKNKKTKVGKINNYKIFFYGICKNCQK